MNQEQVSIGIIIKKYAPKSHKIALLDRYRGRCDVVSFGQTPGAGSLIGYVFNTAAQGLPKISHIRIEDMPLAVARHDLLFLHHVLELCYHFIPVGVVNTDVFELLLYLYTESDMIRCMRNKKYFLFKLLTAVGLYPESSVMENALVVRLQHLSWQQTNWGALDEDVHKKVDEWLRRCVAHHPYIEHFNTVHFLTNE